MGSFHLFKVRHMPWVRFSLYEDTLERLVDTISILGAQNITVVLFNVLSAVLAFKIILLTDRPRIGLQQVCSSNYMAQSEIFSQNQSRYSQL